MQDIIGFSDLENIFTMITKILKYTFLIELGGAIILSFAFFQGGLPTLLQSYLLRHLPQHFCLLQCGLHPL